MRRHPGRRQGERWPPGGSGSGCAAPFEDPNRRRTRTGTLGVRRSIRAPTRPRTRFTMCYPPTKGLKYRASADLSALLSDPGHSAPSALAFSLPRDLDDCRTDSSHFSVRGHFGLRALSAPQRRPSRRQPVLPWLLVHADEPWRIAMAVLDARRGRSHRHQLWRPWARLAGLVSILRSRY
jgi:hypothetical protein